MTKVELEELVEKQENEIKELKEKHQEEVKRLETQKRYLAESNDNSGRRIRELTKANEQKEIELKNKEYELKQKVRAETENEHKVKEAKYKEREEDYKKVVEQLSDEVKRLSAIVNETMNTHGALLKTLQGTVDTHITLNEYAYNKIIKKVE